MEAQARNLEFGGPGGRSRPCGPGASLWLGSRRSNTIAACTCCTSRRPWHSTWHTAPPSYSEAFPAPCSSALIPGVPSQEAEESGGWAQRLGG